MGFRDTRGHNKIAVNTKLGLWDWTRKRNFDDSEECVEVLNNELREMFKSCFPLIKVKILYRDPPYMSTLVKHLFNVRNKTARWGVRHCRQNYEKENPRLSQSVQCYASMILTPNSRLLILKMHKVL